MEAIKLFLAAQMALKMPVKKDTYCKSASAAGELAHSLGITFSEGFAVPTFPGMTCCNP